MHDGASAASFLSYAVTLVCRGESRGRSYVSVSE